MLQERTWTQIFLYSPIHIQLSKKLYLLYFKIYLESAISCDPPFHHPIQFTIIPHLVYFNSFQTSLIPSFSFQAILNTATRMILLKLKSEPANFLQHIS